MIPLSILGLADTISKIILMALEDQPVSVRRANSIIAWNVYWKLIRVFVPADIRAEVEAELKAAVVPTNEQSQVKAA